jgi:surfeit locus 1 family protein
MPSRLRPLLWPTVAAVPVLAALIALGLWQLDRLAWKNALVAAVAERTARAPTPLPAPSAWSALDPDGFEYTPLEVTGRFLHDREAHVFAALASPRGKFGGQGYRIVTPLALADGTYVLVNRGFVPLDRKDPATRKDGQLDGQVTLDGLARRSEPYGTFTPADDPVRNVWFTRDVAKLAAAARLPADKVFPFTLDALASATPPGGLPQGGETVVSFTNNHLNYALTWFGLALTLVGVYIAFARARLRRPDQAGEGS